MSLLARVIAVAAIAMPGDEVATISVFGDRGCKRVATTATDAKIPSLEDGKVSIAGLEEMLRGHSANGIVVHRDTWQLNVWSALGKVDDRYLQVADLFPMVIPSPQKCDDAVTTPVSRNWIVEIGSDVPTVVASKACHATMNLGVVPTEREEDVHRTVNGDEFLQAAAPIDPTQNAHRNVEDVHFTQSWMIYNHESIHVRDFQRTSFSARASQWFAERMKAISASIQGLVAATFTPLDEDATIHRGAIAPTVERLLDQGIAALYVLGSTGEGLSLTYEERCSVAEEFVTSAAGRLPVIVQVGSESLAQSRQLASHAERIGADAVSAVCPVYFKPDSVQTLVASMREIAFGSPSLPFYYYHIPSVTGAAFDALEFLQLAETQIANLRGIKFTSPNVLDFQSCIEFSPGRFDILWGLDEMLHCGFLAGANGAVGSTYNFAAPIYQRLLAAFRSGDLESVRLEQSRSQAIVRTFVPYGPRGAQKAIMKMVGIDCGPSRLPVPTLTMSQYESLESELRAIGFFDWIKPSAEALST